MKIAFGADHAGYRLKKELVQFARSLGHVVIDYGTNSDGSVDYPDYARPVAEAVASGDVERGVLVCASGIGMSIAANKVRGIRAARVDTCAEAEFSRRHNDANVLCFGQRYIDSEEAKRALRSWLETEFEGGRHQRRIDKISEMEETYRPEERQ